GLKTRLVFCEISLQKPHLLLFDEPTNAADMEMIDSMSEAIKNFNGGVVVISHDFSADNMRFNPPFPPSSHTKLLQHVAEEICVEVWDGDIRTYKSSLKKKHGYKKG
ncbi:hypothetical protein B484DRAFT_437983, partial [Ochromonadaceae sp. CCMP2298]